MSTRLFSIAVVTGLLLINPAVYAGGYTIEPSEPERRWAFGAEGLYLSPSMPDLVFAQAVLQNPATYSIGPKDKFTFRIEGSFYINNDTDITVNWLQLHSTQSGVAHATADFDLPNLGIPSPVDVPANGLFSQVDTQLRFEFDAVNVELGNTALLFAGSPNLSTRLHAGIQYARLKNELQSVGTGGFSDDGFVNDSQSFSGIGPRGGIDMQYHLGHGFSIVGKAAGSILIGDFKWHVTDQPPVRDEPTEFNSNKTITVPAIDGRIGAQYAHSISALEFIIEGGFQAARYFDILRTSDFDRDSVGTKHSYGYSGPYLGIKVIG